ncbi:MAG: crossover junction endodeoxyribonuclease RuvC [Candidatus Cloacimonetes bacterium]|nr:crossover junction endodeoxyribonuclease RuvC [Candidatus Cloacimonadota bacterium]MBS3766514.1 crossover junction endodeoxyribonuclease RuvC [Candidatus Cloacimonadota bacterium]
MKGDEIVIMGIDPGSLITGYAILKANSSKILPITYGNIKTSSKNDLQKRIYKIHTEVDKIINQYNPDQCSLEKIFYAKNVRSVLSLGEARGAILISLEQNKIPTYEYTPRKIKKSVVGNGRASKKQVQYMVNAILNTKIDKKSSYDISDALAIGICHYNKIKPNL